MINIREICHCEHVNMLTLAELLAWLSTVGVFQSCSFFTNTFLFLAHTFLPLFHSPIYNFYRVRYSVTANMKVCSVLLLPELRAMFCLLSNTHRKPHQPKKYVSLKHICNIHVVLFIVWDSSLFQAVFETETYFLYMEKARHYIISLQNEYWELKPGTASKWTITTKIYFPLRMKVQ